MSLLWLSLIPVGTAQPSGQAGAVRGTVLDADFGDPISDARILIQELSLETLSRDGGVYVFENVEAGVYTIAVVKPGYIRKIERDILVKPGEVISRRIELEGEIYEMEQMVVEAGDLLGGAEIALLELRQDTSSLMDSIGSDLISKAGASDAADALKLVVGTTIQDGKYATVRGLADRYTRTVVNGMSVPSPDPEKRAVQVDIFPSSILESINVNKTFTPNMPGDASGGLVDIRLKSIPSGPVAKVNSKVGFNSQTTFNDNFKTYNGGGVNFLGIHGSDKDHPNNPINSAGNFPSVDLTGIGIFTPNTPLREESNQLMDEFARGFDSGFAPVPGATTPDYGFGVTVGDKLDLGKEGAEAGTLLTFDYNRKFRYRTGERSNYVADDTGPGTIPRLDRQGITEESTTEVLWSALWNSAVRFSPDHEVNIQVGHTQAAEDEVSSRFDDFDFVPTTNTIGQSLIYEERMLSNLQVRSSHEFPELNDLRMDIRAGVARGSQDNPDIRLSSFFFDENTGLYTLVDPSAQDDLVASDKIQRISRKIEELQFQASVDLVVPFETHVNDEKSDSRRGELKFGPHWETLERDFDQIVYNLVDGIGNAFTGVRSNNLAVVGQGTSTGLIVDNGDNIGDQGFDSFNANPVSFLNWNYQPPSAGPVEYTGQQDIRAFYGMIESPITDKLDAGIGGRVELTRLEIELFKPAGLPGNFFVLDDSLVDANGFTRFSIVPSPTANPVELQQVDFLPAVWSSYKIKDDMTIRLAWSQTIARPTFRELAEVLQIDALGDTAFIGNSKLQISKLTNYDARWEWFPNPGDVFAASIFYKEIKDPIELVGINASGQNVTFPTNFDSGFLWGAEFEARKNLGFLGESMEYFSVGSNFTYVQSEVKVPENIQGSLQPFGLTRETQPLQGQPEFIFNANAGFDHPEWGTSLAVFLNWEAQSLINGAAGALPADTALLDSYKEANYEMNVTFSQKLTEWLTLKLSGKNVLNPEIRTYYQDTVGNRYPRSSYRKGVDFSLSLSAEF